MTNKKESEIDLIDEVDFYTIISLALRVSFTIRAGEKTYVLLVDGQDDLHFADLVDVIWRESNGWRV